MRDELGRFVKGYCPTTCFKKKSVAWNKGTKGLCKPNKTSFKKGNSINKGKHTSPKTEFRSGAEHPNWKGGVSKEIQELRNTNNYREWRKKVYERDCWTCQQCGYKGDKISAHHIYPFRDYPEFRFDVENGETLCCSCHRVIEVMV